MSNLFSNIKVTLYNIITLMTVPVKVQLEEKKKERNHSKNLKKSCHLVTKSCLNLCDPKDCSTPGFPVLHYLPEFAKFMSIESVMLCNNLILCCFPSALNLSQHQGLFHMGFSRQEYWGAIAFSEAVSSRPY